MGVGRIDGGGEESQISEFQISNEARGEVENSGEAGELQER